MEVVCLAQAKEDLLAVMQQLRQRRVAIAFGEVAHLRVADGIEQASVPCRTSVVEGEGVVEDGGAEPSVATEGVPRLGLILRQPLRPEARQRVPEEKRQRAEVRPNGAIVEKVRQLVGDDLAEPFLRPGPGIGHLVGMHPDVRIAITHGCGEAVGDFIFVGEIEAQAGFEGDAQVFREGVVGGLGDGGGFGLDAGEVGGRHDLEVGRLGHLPVEFGVVAPVEGVEALRPRRGRQQAHPRKPRQKDDAPGGLPPAFILRPSLRQHLRPALFVAHAPKHTHITGKKESVVVPCTPQSSMGPPCRIAGTFSASSAFFPAAGRLLRGSGPQGRATTREAGIS